MKREKFLWPLTQGHHGALVAARNIRDRLSRLSDDENDALLALAQEVSKFFSADLEQHFYGEEEELLKIFERHVGPNDPGIKKILEDHRSIRQLSKSTVKKDIQLFADSLTNHIRFEEDVFFPRVEKTLTIEEKALETEKLLPYKPSETHALSLSDKPAEK